MYRVRRTAFYFIVFTSLLALIVGWRWDRHWNFSAQASDRNQITGDVLQTTSAVGGIALALVFITAQLAGSKSSVRKELYYANPEVYLLGIYLTSTLLLGFVLLSGIIECCYSEALSTLLVLAATCVLLVGPVLVLQIENLNPVTLARKLADGIVPRKIIPYGLTDVRRDNAGYYYRLVTVGIRPKGVDPFRPLHEVIKEAVDARDRVLFGKLIREFLRPIARVHGVPWSRSGVEKEVPKRNFVSRVLAARYDMSSRIHLTLAIMHYCVKRARNLVREWDERDIGRHGILTGTGDIIRSLAVGRDNSASIRIALFASLHISKDYAKIKPFGRVEPLRVHCQAAEELYDHGYIAESLLAVDILAWIVTHTKQLSLTRVPSYRHGWRNEKVIRRFEASVKRARRDMEWLPGDEVEDPWRNWLD